MVSLNLGSKFMKYTKKLEKICYIDLMHFEKVLIECNPVYDWFIDNDDNVTYTLLKAFMTNIIPLGYPGKRYFKKIVNGKRGLAVELWRLYNELEIEYWLGDFEIATYSELISLGYNGIHLGGNTPADDIFKYIGKEAIRTFEACGK